MMSLTVRQERMRLLALASVERLEAGLSAITPPDYEVVRGPETGLVMIRGRVGNTGDAFNMGEALATRCVVSLKGGCLGYAWILGEDARRAELVDHVVKPLERELALARFDLVPAEDGEGHSVDASLGHQVDVLVQRLLRPLIRIVVTAERDATTIRRQQRRPTECSASSHINQVLYCIGLWPMLCCWRRPLLR